METPIYERPAELLQQLIRFDTTNPPGNERPCAEFINNLLVEHGFETSFVARNPQRPNLLTRLKGQGKAPPLLLYAHMDVVTTAGQKWTYPPFSAQIADGFVWGRGAIDNKHTLAMYLCAMLKARAQNLPLPGDILFAATADEEVASVDGARFLVEEHADLFHSVRYALGEFGGFNLDISGRRFYPIQTSEKQSCPVRLTFHGPGGHAASPVLGGAMAKLATALRRLDSRPLPMHITPPVAQMLTAFSHGLGGPTGLLVRLLLHPILGGLVLRALGSKVALFSPLLHNTASPTMVRASDKHNVIPSEVVLGLDGRLLPGLTAADMEQEIIALLGRDVQVHTDLPQPGPATTDMGLFDCLAASLRTLDPQALPVPYVNPAVTDARFFARLGIQTYGFTPLQLPPSFNFISTIHAADERVPVSALDFGVQAVLSVLQTFH